MLGYIIGFILLVLALFIFGFISRKRVYDAVDRHESWKIEILNRNIATELARVKDLNLTGETQESFEVWKERWEDIVTKRLPNVEEYLFDAEEAADRYRFRYAKQVLEKIEQSLRSTEDDIDQILLELNELMESEELSRKEIDKLTPKLKELRQKLTHFGYGYGKAEKRFTTSIRELEKQLQTYDELVEAGNYLQAKGLVKQVSIELEELEERIGEYPEILKICTEVLPNQLDDMLTGLLEMKREGYHVEHLLFEEEIHSNKQRLKECVELLENGSVSEVQKITTEIDEGIVEMYDQLEKEALAKNYVEAQIPQYQKLLAELDARFNETKLEVEVLRKTYYFEDQDMENYLSLDKTITKTKADLEKLAMELEKRDTAHSKLRVKLEAGLEQLHELKEKQLAFKTQIRNLRKDELEAKEQLAAIREQINGLHRKLKKSNLPGIPPFIWELLEEASKKNEKVIKALDKAPLDMSEIQHALSEADAAILQTVEQTDVMLEQAYLTEQVIQYANRYRSHEPMLAANLIEAERLFRSFEYELALEKSAQAIEEVEPGSLRKIEGNQEALSMIE